MQKHLYFVCPTDYLEVVIDQAFRRDNYYCTSLGNSIAFDSNTVGQINGLLETKNISEISFVLSDDNPIVLDAMGKQHLLGVTGMYRFYKQLIQQKEHVEVSWQSCNHELLILSHHLNNKIKELKLGLENVFVDQPKISGKIYKRRERCFCDIYSDLLCDQFFGLN